jgi:hypothetical protein
VVKKWHRPITSKLTRTFLDREGAGDA